MNSPFPVVWTALIALVCGSVNLPAAMRPDPLLTSLDDSILQLMQTYPDYRSAGESLLEELEAARAAEGVDVVALQHKIAVSHPRLQEAPVLFTTRHQFKKDHHNTATLFQPNEINKRSYQHGGSALKAIDFRKGGTVTTLIDPGESGVVRDPEVSWDGEHNVYFNASYMELHRKKLVDCVGGGPSQIQPAYAWGSHTSRLTKLLAEGHKDVKLNAEEMDRIVTWVDMNAPYYPTYDSAHPKNPTGRSPLTGAQLKELSKLTGAKFVANHNGNAVPQVSFERPELSPCLQNLDTNSEGYVRALAIIRAGAEELKQRTRADMPGFRPADYAQERQRFYDERRGQELAVRKAMREGLKVYDP